MLQITKEQIGDHLTLALDGRLDRSTAADFEARINDLLDGVSKLTLDFSKLEYISSAGLRVVLSIQKKMKNTNDVLIKGASSEIRDIFEMTGFSRILNVSWL